MAISSINFQKVSTHSLKHNDRTEEKTAKTVFQEFSHKNICDTDSKSALQNFNELYKDSIAKVTGKERRADKKNTLVEAVVNIKPNTTMEDLKNLQKHIEKELGFKGLQIAIHRDEGHYDDNGKFITNEHAHLSFFTLDRQNGRQMFRREHITRDKLRELQTKTANILNMDRGKSKEETGRERLSHKDYKQAKKVEVEKVKDLLATKEQLKEENNQLRAFMKDNGANRADYAELEKEKKILEEQLKAKELTQERLLERFKQIQDNFIKEKEHLKSIVELKEIDILDLKSENKSLEALKSDLTSKVITLQEKINSSSNMNLSQPSIDIQEEFKRIKNEELEEKEVKTGIFSSEKIKVLKSDSNILQRTWNLVASKYEDLKVKYNNLVKKFDALQKENLDLKEKVRALQSEAPKQIKKETKDHLAELVENLEAGTKIQKPSSNLQKLKKRDYDFSR